MSEAEIYQTLLGFCGREQHALTEYIAMRKLNEDCPVTVEAVAQAGEQNAAIRKFLDERMMAAQGK